MTVKEVAKLQIYHIFATFSFIALSNNLHE